MAIETLLISDKLFRSKDLDKRKYYVRLHDKGVRDGLNVVVFSSMSPSGIRLSNMTGIAAILRFVMPGLDDISEDEGSLDSDAEVSEPAQSHGDSSSHMEEENKSDRMSEADQNYLDDVF